MGISCCRSQNERVVARNFVMTPVTGARVLAIAAPVVLSNATVPIQGAIDTAIIGNLGSAFALAGVGIGAEMFAILFTSFNFLQLGCSGQSAQALGAGNYGRVLNTLLRTLVIAACIALVLIVFQTPLLWLGLSIFEGGAETEAVAAQYFNIRIWGAPFELANYALLGWFTGQELTNRLFQHQLVITLSNIALSLTLAVGFEMGITGVAVATVIANGLGLTFALWVARRRKSAIAPEGWNINWPRIFEASELWRVMAMNRDIFIRTALLTVGFAWILRLGSLQGDETLAANVVLWQFFILASYGLDGFAMAAETLVGQARGSGDAKALRQAAVISSLWSGALAVAVALLFVALSGTIIDTLTNVESVRTLARDYVLWAALVPAVGFAAFQLDGIFIGATETGLMRNAMLASAAVYFPASWLLAEAFGNHGVWGSIYLFLALRTISLLWLYPELERRTSAPIA